MHIGLFGGTFNPIHACHLRIAAQVQTELKLDQVTFIPTGDPPHKEPTSLAPAFHRLAMVQLALQGYPTFSVSDVEVRSSGLSYTIDTVSLLKQEYSSDTEWSFIVGLDAFFGFPQLETRHSSPWSMSFRGLLQTGHALWEACLNSWTSSDTAPRLSIV